MVKPPTQKQRRIIKAKIQGTSNKDIGRSEYPQATPQSQAVLVSRELKKPNVAQYMEQGKLIALKKHNVTWDRIMQTIDRGLDAKKTDHYSGAEVDDIGTQLRAAKQASDYMEIRKDISEPAAPLNSIPADWTEIQIAKAWKTPPPQA